MGTISGSMRLRALTEGACRAGCDKTEAHNLPRSAQAYIEEVAAVPVAIRGYWLQGGFEPTSHCLRGNQNHNQIKKRGNFPSIYESIGLQRVMHGIGSLRSSQPAATDLAALRALRSHQFGIKRSRVCAAGKALATKVENPLTRLRTGAGMTRR